MMMDLNKHHPTAMVPPPPPHPGTHEDDSTDGGHDDYELDEHGNEGKSSKPWVPAIDDPNYFEVLSPEEIYDSFFNIRRMGFIANRIIRKLNETKHIVSSKILEKRKKLKALQRKQFEQLSPAGIEYLKVLLKMEIAAIKNMSSDGGLNPSPSIKCRLAHLALDINTSSILARIYDADQGIHNLDLWKVLALDYVNNPMWQPRRIVNDDRLHDVDPSRAPDEKFTPESLRSVFARLRIDYTKTLLKFTSSIKLTVPVSREAIDQEFWERFAKHDKALYYLFHLFRDRTMQDCLLVDQALMRQDALDHLDASNAANNGNPALLPMMVANGGMGASSAAALGALVGGNPLNPRLGGGAANNGGLFTTGASGANVNAAGNKRDRDAAGLSVDDEEALELLGETAGAGGASGMLSHLMGYPGANGGAKRVRLDDVADAVDLTSAAAAVAGSSSSSGGSGGAAPNGAPVNGGSPASNLTHIAWQSSIRKDRAVANYYKRLTINADIRFYQELLARDNIGEAIKRNAKTKMNLLLMKKIEDRYDDLVFN
eukprot:gene4698-3366_t